MNDIIEKIQFDFLCALAIIKEEKGLMNLYKNKYRSEDLNMISYQYKKDFLKPEIYSFIENIFNNYILKNENLIKKYIGVKVANGIELPKSKDPYKTKKILPKKFGKQATLKKIKDQGGKKLLIDELSLANNDVRNLYEKILKLVIHDIHRDKKKLTDERCERMIKAINDLKNIVNE